ncbi:Mitochondrial import inner membrane translocase subunit Tim16 [Kalmanozyma brasiliensis GHG001]|uniref:Mitochondrial import inner membrane translocase subunit TIM16 n=1 Tax=Kalmanozyma brasiliensis (strain GHG001) TaxID=1365824 RepID=V5GUJ4_KALBG|nr:Mitochondrial import inner membrane translocase subunit Tim16 [Kalmanozyma brasiliensis GHG001]EST09547.1 Mitochondrial import inner membrane translocase subunit Tim16 [Kalmanozyma brasiliensis GHG001]
MSLPKALAQILFVGTQIVGKAFLEAGRQAGRNARAGRVEASAAGAAGVGSGSAASPSDQLTRTHRMTLDEAKLILNLKQDVSAAGLSKSAPAAAATEGEGKSILDQVREAMVKNYDHLFATNAPPAPKGQTGGGAGSFYIQSKVVRARERIEAEWGLLNAGKEAEAGAADASAAEGKADQANKMP